MLVAGVVADVGLRGDALGVGEQWESPSASTFCQATTQRPLPQAIRDAKASLTGPLTWISEPTSVPVPETRRIITSGTSPLRKSDHVTQ